MTRRVILRPQVADDLHQIVVWLENHATPAVADRFVQAVFAAFDDLAGAPGKGSPKQYRARRLAGIRSWAVPGFANHLIFYQTIPEAIRVLAVTHGARDMPKLLKGRAS